jgi:hypothetical protein
LVTLRWRTTKLRPEARVIGAGAGVGLQCPGVGEAGAVVADLGQSGEISRCSQIQVSLARAARFVGSDVLAAGWSVGSAATNWSLNSAVAVGAVHGGGLADDRQVQGCG